MQQSKTRGKVLVVDDDRAMCELLDAGLGKQGFEVTAHTSPRAARATVGRERWDVILTDIHMAEQSGLELCREVNQAEPGLPVVVITAFGDMTTAVAAIRAGAYDFISKPVDIEVVAIALDRAVEHHRMHAEVRRLRERVGPEGPLSGLLGESEPMRRVRDLIARVADTESSVLVTGESGTGKELAARGLHDLSRRRGGPFVAVNCAAMPETLLESELFGHERGAFTDAKTSRQGLFLQAHRGTLLLDEIGEMPPGMQAKLLRAIEQRTVRPVGGQADLAFDARLLASTNRDIETDVEEGRFRADLYYRLNVVELEMPPLRSRGNDVLLLAQHFLSSSALASGKDVRGLSPDAARALLSYDWPGNIRELRNSIERAVIIARYDLITADDLPDRIRQPRPRHVLVTAEDPSELVPLEQMERRYVERVLDAVGGQKAAAARILGLDRRTLYRKLERWHEAG